MTTMPAVPASQAPNRERLCAVAVLTVAMLVGCGGGGGGSTAGPPPAPASPSTPLTFSAQNAAPAAAIAIGFTETALLLGRWAYDEIEAQRQRTVTAASGPCASGGVREVTLNDADGSGTVTPGDTLRLRLTGCWVPLLESALTGTVDLRMTAPAAADGLAALLSIDSGGLRAGSAGAAEVVLGGGFAFDGRVGEDDSAMSISALPSTDLSLALSASNRLVVERLTPTAISHRMDLRTARYEYRSTATLRSEALPGQVELTTTTPLAGWLDTLPDGGRLRIGGAGASSIVVQPGLGAGSNVAMLRIDADGNGAPEIDQAIDWNQMFEGYPWWPQARPRPNEAARLLGPGQATPSLAVRRTPALQDVVLRPSLQFDFTLPLDAAALPQFKLVRLPASTFFWGRPDDDWGDQEIVLTAAVDGTRLVLGSPTQLQPGRTYELRTRAAGSTTDDLQLHLRDALGRVTTVFLGALTTRNDFTARADFAMSPLAGAGPNDLSIDAGRSVDARHALATYRWRQLSGPAVEIASPAAAQTVVRWSGAPPTAPATALLELTVTNAAGEVDVATLPIAHVPVAGVPTLYFRSTPGSYVGDGKVGSVAVGNGTVSAFVQPGSDGLSIRWIEEPAPSFFGPFWLLAFSRQDGVPLAPGVYTTGYFAFDGDARSTSPTAHIVHVIDVAWDADGKITRLALDFAMDSPDTRLYGSVRLNSTVPIRP